MKYENDTQILEDATKLMLECHMADYDSDRRRPSNEENRSTVMTKVLYALIDAVEDWDSLGEKEKGELSGKAKCITDMAAAEANKKWLAAMMLLGF